MRDETGAEIGKIAAVQNFGGGDVLELTMAGRKDVLIPFTQAAVPVVDIEGGFIEVDAVAAGLVDEDEAVAEGFDPEQRPRGPKEAGGNR